MNVSRTSLWLVLVVIARVASSVPAADQYDERHDHGGTRASYNHHRFAGPTPLHDSVTVAAAADGQEEATDRSTQSANRLHAEHNAIRVADDRGDGGLLAIPQHTNGDRLDKRRPLPKDNHREDNGDIDKNELGEMQVGCAHGLFDIKLPPAEFNDAKRDEKRRIYRRAAVQEFQRKRRNFPTNTFTVWQQPVYPVNRPYVIPVLGSAGGLPIYFPPQPIYYNQPSDPRKSYLPPKGYLPPPTTTATIGFDDEDEDDEEPSVPLFDRKFDPMDDAPIWDIEPPRQQPPRPPPPSRTTPRPTGGIPTRRTRRPNIRTTTLPPLIHRSENNTVNQGANSLRPQQPDRPTVFEVPSESIPSRQPSNSLGFPTQRPAQRPTPPPRVPVSTPSSRPQPSRCVWAIISCCTGTTRNISYSCFEQLGCQGAFWDQNPCDSDFAKAAIDVALQYYSKK